MAREAIGRTQCARRSGAALAVVVSLASAALALAGTSTASAAGVSQISAGGDHTCAIKTGGRPVCWGDNLFGQTDIPAGIGTVSQIDTGRSYTCAVKTDGTPVCWGANDSG